ncbi:unnamed protein product [Chironomus riparius]|uniref:G-protein coupled receptors family 2 profile 2 domain-containing protein n=1 Tax=Chironomus riparius TaxID=315576 RepID=A0A9N9WWZ1_9DIPT|nr:unnamed protein product [Chironomus riparius]
MDLHKFIIILLIFCVNVIHGKQEPQKCCRNEKNLLIDRRCVPDRTGKSPNIILACEEKYMLNPYEMEEDAFNVTEDASLFVPDMGSSFFRDEYCLVNSHDEELNETYEIALVCFPENDTEIVKVSFTLKAIFIFISVFFLFLTLYIYYRLPELRQTQDKVTMFTISCLTIFLIFLGSMQIYSPYTSKYDICLFLAYPTYFFTMAYFAWLNCVIINVWKSVVLRRWMMNEGIWYMFNHIYAWTIPAILMVIVDAKHTIKPSLGVESCWFHQNHDQWMLVYLPISIMLGLNVILCIWSSIYLVNPSYTPDTIKALRYKCFLYLKLLLLGGFTWIFEVLSYTYNDHSPSAWFWVIIDSLNCLHGVLVFCVLILWRRRIRKELSRRKIMGIRWPSSWDNIDDDEEEEVCLENEGNKTGSAYPTNMFTN